MKMESNLSFDNGNFYEISMSEGGDLSQNSKSSESATPEAGSTVKKLFAISLPEAERNLFDSSLIFNSIADALKVLKKHPQARCKEFKTLHDAHHFISLPFNVSCGGEHNPLSVFSPCAAEKNSTSFKSLTSQEMVKLRKHIEAGNETVFLDMVWSNPYYLISNWDGPTILQEGTRYNALHVAARSRQTNLCSAILNTLQDLRFLRLLYPDDKELMLVNFQRRLLDLYINMPDKSLNETPLHFACKFGVEKIVQILLSFVNCERNKANKYGVLPMQMICERSIERSEDLKNRIKSLFEGMHYVPVLRNSNNTEPIIGEPCTEDIMIKCISFPEFQCFEQNQICFAFAGPILYSEAKKLFFAWRKKNFSELFKYTKDQVKEMKNIILSDPLKGLERVGRQLTKDLSIGWLEYFKALDAWIDITSDNGLQLLETHLKCQSEMKNLLSSSLDMEEKCDALVKFLEEGLIKKFCKSAFDIIMTADMKKGATIIQLFQILIPYIFCLTSSSFSNDTEFISKIHNEIGHLLYLKFSLCVSDKDLHEFIMYLNTKFESFSSKSRNWAFLTCILKSLWFHHLTHISESHVFKKQECSCVWISKDYSYSTPVLYNKLTKRREEMCYKMLNEEEHIFQLGALESAITSLNTDSLLSFEDSDSSLDENYFTPPESPQFFSITEETSINTTPICVKFSFDLGDKIYINGSSEMMDEDIDLYRGIEKIVVKEQLYPYVFKWKFLIESNLEGILRPESELSRTPASASSTIKRRIKEIGKITPKTLF